MNKGGQTKCFLFGSVHSRSKSIRTIDRTFRRLQNGIFKVLSVIKEQRKIEKKEK